MTSRKDDFPKLDFDSPKIIAAMKVTGIEMSEILEPKGSEVDPNSPRGDDGEQRRFELMERKRRNLLRELDDTAATLDEHLVEAILSPSMESGQEARTLLDSEKRKIDQKRDRAKAEMQRELQKEIEKKQAYESTQRGRDDYKKRAKEKSDEKADELQKRFDEVDRRRNKQEETLNKTRKDDWSKRKETMRKLEESNERVNKQAEQRREEWAGLSEERRRKMAEIAEKNLEAKQAQEEDRANKFEVSLAKQREREERMQKAAHEALQTKRSKFADKMATVSETMKDQQADRERIFKENAERLERARQASRDHQVEVAERARTHREKETELWTNNREKNRKENADKMKKLRAEINDGHQKSVEVREKFLEETVYKQAKTKGCMEEIVQQNKARIARSEECAREQTLAKIRHTKDKMHSTDQQRREVLKYRTDALRDEMVGRTQVHEMKTIVKEASTKRINQLLKDLGMPPLPTGPIKEEGDDDKKQ